MTATRAEKVLMRTKPCNCGCKGADSWHLMWFKRVVKTTDGKTGTIKTPWGEEEVEMGTIECDGKLHNTYWKKKGLKH
jgi:hypothetical protein